MISDGFNTLYVMAKKLGFTALVITDHYDSPFMNKEGRRLQKPSMFYR